MNTVNYDTVRTNLAQWMERVALNHDPVVITKSHQRSVVLIALDDYRALEETAFLLGTPENAFGLLSSAEPLDLDQGQFQDLDL